MKSIYDQLKQFIKAQKPSYICAVVVFCAIGIYLNYFEGFKQFLKSRNGIEEYVTYFILYLTFSVGGYLLYSITHNDFAFWKKRGFIVLLILGCVVFCFRSSFYGHTEIIEALSTPERAYLNRLIYGDLFRLSYLIIPVAIIWFVADRHTQPLYGFSQHNHKWKIYFMLLLLMVPLVAFASTQSDFLNYYPRMRKLTVYNVSVFKLLLYELCYGLDFISIELFFRGFMILAFAKYVGIRAVLPTACFYMSIHFGKPMGEAISSFFGGTVLGVISYHSKSIYGGIMVHVGIAWLMETGGILGNWLKGQ